MPELHHRIVNLPRSQQGLLALDSWVLRTSVLSVLNYDLIGRRSSHMAEEYCRILWEDTWLELAGP